MNLCCRLSCTNIFSNPGATTYAADHGKISGAVFDSLTSAGVEFANVALLDPATKKPIMEMYVMIRQV